MRGYWRLLALIVPVSLGPLHAHANPVDVSGLGSRSVALGGAVSADVRDFSANYYNPAGLALAQGLELSLGAAGAWYDLQLDGADSPLDPVRGLVGGLVAPGTVAGVPLAFGMAGQIAGSQLAHVRSLSAERPLWALYEERGRRVYFSANLALSPLPWLAVGAGIAFLASSQGGFLVQGTALQPGAGKTIHDSPLRHEVVADLRPVRSPQLGVWAQLMPGLAMALVYRGQASLELELQATLEGHVQLAGLLPVPARYAVTSETISGFGPRQLVLGVHSSQLAWLRLNADLVWVHWSRYQNPISQSDGALKIGIPAMVPMPDPATGAELAAARLSDRIVPRLGAESRLALGERWWLPVRLGYVFEASPLSQQTPRYLVDANRHSLSVGFGLHTRASNAVFRGSLGLDVHLFGALVPERVRAGIAAKGSLSGAGLVLTAKLKLK